jgi:hypothetical protein
MPSELLKMLDLDPKSVWMVLFAFWASLVLTLVKIGEALISAFRQPRLNLHLTQDVFFRLTDFGEALFCNPVLLAWNGPVLISTVTACLTKTDAPQKSFPLKVLAFGEKVRGQGPIADHYFHSKSPIAHVAPGLPQRAVYLCVQEQYEGKTKLAIESFRKKILDYKAELLAKAGAQQLDNQEVVKVLVKAVDNGLTELMDLVQLEPGRYKLVVQIGYSNPASRFLNRSKLTQSSVSFVVEPHVRDYLRTNLRETLMTGATNTVLDQNHLIRYPEYQPTEITEHVR